MAKASDIISKLVSFVEEAAKSSLSAATMARLKTIAVLLGEGGDMLESYLEAKYPNLDALLGAIETIEDDAIKAEGDVQALIALIQGKGATTTVTTAEATA